MRALNLKPCKFSFEDSTTHDGFTDGTTWNGWANVWVTPDVHAAVLADCGEFAGDLADLEEVDGLVSYACGYCTTIEDPTPDPMDVHAERLQMPVSELVQMLENTENLVLAMQADKKDEAMPAKVANNIHAELTKTVDQLEARLEANDSANRHTRRELNESRRMFMELYKEKRTLALRFEWLESAATDVVRSKPADRNDLLIRLCDELGLEECT